MPQKYSNNIYNNDAEQTKNCVLDPGIISGDSGEPRVGVFNVEGSQVTEAASQKRGDTKQEEFQPAAFMTESAAATLRCPP